MNRIKERLSPSELSGARCSSVDCDEMTSARGAALTTTVDKSMNNLEMGKKRDGL